MATSFPVIAQLSWFRQPSYKIINLGLFRLGTCFFFSFLSCYMKRLDGGRSFLSQMKYSRLPEKWQTDSTLSRFYYLTLIFYLLAVDCFHRFSIKVLSTFCLDFIELSLCAREWQGHNTQKGGTSKTKSWTPLETFIWWSSLGSIGDTSVKMSLNLPSILVAVCKLVRPPPHIHKDKANVLDVAPDLAGLICWKEFVCPPPSRSGTRRASRWKAWVQAVQ